MYNKIYKIKYTEKYKIIYNFTIWYLFKIYTPRLIGLHTYLSERDFALKTFPLIHCI